MFTNSTALRSVATRDMRQAEQFGGRTPGLWLSEPTDGMPHQRIIDPAGTVLPAPGCVEGSIR